jgi:hypothetical protein
MNKVLTTIIFLSLFIFLPVSAQAAMLFSSLPSELYTDETFALDVYVSSPNEAINAVSGTISFPQDKLEVVSLFKDDSVFDLWINDPSFSNELGEINFEGIMLDSKSISEKGKIVRVVFKVKEAGFAQIYFSSGSVLADNGEGTNILKELGSNTLLLN